MFTSDKDRNDGIRKAMIYLAVSITLGIAGAIYEHFSFGVYSYFMIYAFAFPLIGGTLPYMIKALKGNRTGEARISVPAEQRPDTENKARRCFAGALWNAAIATLTIGSVLHGALQICGRPNSLAAVYPLAAAVLIILAAAEHTFCIRKLS